MVAGGRWRALFGCADSLGMSAFPTGPVPSSNTGAFASGITGQAAAERAEAARESRRRQTQAAARRDLRDSYEGVADVEATDATDAITDELEETHDERKRRPSKAHDRSDDAGPDHPRLDLQA